MTNWRTNWEKDEEYITKANSRNKCELCGKKLKVPETDITKCATCDKCIKGQYK